MISPDGLAIRPRMPAELADLLDAAAGAGVGHQEDRVQVRLAVADVVLAARPSSAW